MDVTLSKWIALFSLTTMGLNIQRVRYYYHPVSEEEKLSLREIKPKVKDLTWLCLPPSWVWIMWSGSSALWGRGHAEEISVCQRRGVQMELAGASKQLLIRGEVPNGYLGWRPSSAAPASGPWCHCRAECHPSWGNRTPRDSGLHWQNMLRPQHHPSFNKENVGEGVGLCKGHAGSL